jgi:hypothetical protein
MRNPLIPTLCPALHPSSLFYKGDDHGVLREGVDGAGPHDVHPW